MQKTGYKTEMTVRRAFGLYASSPIYVRMCSGCPSYRIFDRSKTQLFTHRKSVKKSQMAVVCALGYKQAAASLTGAADAAPVTLLREALVRHLRCRTALRASGADQAHTQTNRLPGLRPFRPVVRQRDTENQQRGGTGVCAEPLANRPSFAAVRLYPCRIGCVFRSRDRSFVRCPSPKKRQSLSPRVINRHTARATALCTRVGYVRDADVMASVRIDFNLAIRHRFSPSVW